MYKPEDARNKLARPALYRCTRCGAAGPVRDFDPAAVPPAGAYRIEGCTCPGGRTNWIERHVPAPTDRPEGTPEA